MKGITPGKSGGAKSGDAKGGMVEEDPACQEPPAGDDDATAYKMRSWINDISISLDRAEKHAAEWGHASIASAVLAEGQNNSRFAVGAKKDYHFFQSKVRASTQGAAARYLENTTKMRLEGQYGAGSLRESEDETAMADQQARRAEAKLRQLKAEQQLREFQTAGSTTSPPAAPEIPPQGEDGEDLPGEQGGVNGDLLPDLKQSATNEGSANNIFVDSTFYRPQELLTKGKLPAEPGAEDAPGLPELALIADELKLSESDILKVAGSNMVTMNWLNYITDPGNPGANNVPWFMVTQVSVAPGSRTRQGYSAETTLRPYYAERCIKDGKEVIEPNLDPDVLHPGIFAAFPLVEAQAVDLRNSERFETRLSMALAAKLLMQGKQAEAKFFLEKMTKVQQDVATRSLLPVVVPSSNGREVTYRFDPALQGLVDPGNRKAGSGQVLNANSVPALIVIMTDKSKLPEFDHLFFELHTRWIPTKKANLWSSAWSGVTVNYNRRRGMRPSDVLNAAEGLDVARQRFEWFDQVKPGLSSVWGDTLQQARYRYSALSNKIGSSNSMVSLPVHYSVSPASLKMVRGKEHNIIVQQISGTETDFRLNSMTSLSIGGFEIDTKAAMDAEAAATLAAAATAEAQGKLAAARKDTAAAPGKLETLLDQTKSGIEIQEELEKKKQEELRKKQEGLEKQDPPAAPPAPPANGPALPPAPARDPGKDKSKEDLRKELEITERRIADLGETQGRISELTVLLDGKPERVSEIAGGLKAMYDQKKINTPAFDNKALTQVVQIAGSAARISDLSQKVVEKEEAASAAEDKKRKLGSLVLNRRSFVIRFPEDRTFNLPAGKLPIVGHFDGGSQTFGEITVEDSPLAMVDSPRKVTFPAEFPKEGYPIVLNGDHLDQVQSAYFSDGKGSIELRGRGKKVLTLLVTTKSEKAPQIILSSSVTPAVSGENLDSIEVTTAKAPEAVLAITDKVVSTITSDPRIVVSGTFPDPADVTATLTSLGGTQSINAAAIDSKVKGQLTLKFMPEKFALSPESANKLTLTLESKSTRKSVSTEVQVLENRAMLRGPVPSIVAAEELGTDKMGGMVLVTSFDDGVFGKDKDGKDLTSAKVSVVIGGILVKNLEVQKGSAVNIEISSAELAKLKGSKGEQDLGLLVRENLFLWSKKVMIK